MNDWVVYLLFALLFFLISFDARKVVKRLQGEVEDEQIQSQKDHN